MFKDGFEAAAPPITAPIGSPSVTAAVGSYRVPSAELREVLDGNAIAIYELRDINGVAAKLYARVFDGKVQYALAGRAANGDLRLGSWQSYSGEPTLSWTARYTPRGWMLGSVGLE